MSSGHAHRLKIAGSTRACATNILAVDELSVVFPEFEFPCTIKSFKAFSASAACTRLEKVSDVVPIPLR